MTTQSIIRTRGQSSVEYALILALIATVILVVVAALGTRVQEMYEVPVEQLTSLQGESSPSGIQGLVQDFTKRIEDFHAENGRWPRSWGDYRFSDLGLNAEDWAGPVEGIHWNPNGNKVGLGNEPGDGLQVYVDTPSGDTLEVHDGWNVWCPVGDSSCYYHTVTPGNEVDISTMVVVSE